MLVFFEIQFPIHLQIPATKKNLKIKTPYFKLIWTCRCSIFRLGIYVSHFNTAIFFSIIYIILTIQIGFLLEALIIYPTRPHVLRTQSKEMALLQDSLRKTWNKGKVWCRQTCKNMSTIQGKPGQLSQQELSTPEPDCYQMLLLTPLGRFHSVHLFLTRQLVSPPWLQFPSKPGRRLGKQEKIGRNWLTWNLTKL